MKNLARYASALTIAFLVSGCDTGSPLAEGVPKDVDFSKSYSPAVPVGPISPGDIKKAKAKEAKEAPAPKAETPAKS